MNTMITQNTIFDYAIVEELGDLERIHMCLAKIPAKDLLDTLNAERKNGRNDYPNEMLLNILIVKTICQCDTMEKIRRELLRNPTLRRICGLKDEDYRYGKKDLVPEPRVFTLFLKRLEKHQDLLDIMFLSLTEDMYELIPGFGEELAGDGKYLDSYAPNDHHKDCGDGRCESDARYSIKEYAYKDAQGKTKKKKETHYGHREHVIVDAKTELPIVFDVTPANVGEREVMLKLLDSMNNNAIDKAKYLILDRGYDGIKFQKKIKKKGIKPIVDNRIMRKGDATIQYKNSNIYYTEAGWVYYLDYELGEEIDDVTGLPKYFAPMKYEGYDKIRNSLRYSYKGKAHRIKVTEDERVFNEVARDSKKFKRLYNKRTSVERYNGRIDRDYGFENHTIRGLKKMKLMVTLVNIIMLVLAKAHIHKEQTNYASMLKF